MGVTIGPESFAFAQNLDDARIMKADRQASLASKEARIARQNEKSMQNELYEETEGILYGPGIAD